MLKPGHMRSWRIAAVVTVATFGVTAGTAQRPALAMLSTIDAGNWEIRLRNGASPVERLCVTNARRLIQLRHRASSCSELIIDDGPNDVTVQYTCRGRGYGRTHIRRENGRLIQIESQGIADGLPFDFAAEGRRVGDCAS